MTGKEGALGSDLTLLDSREPESEDYADIPELPDAWFEHADLHEGGRLIRRGRPRAAAPKQAISIRLSADVLAHFRSTGPGWQSRIDQVLRDWVNAEKKAS